MSQQSSLVGDGLIAHVVPELQFCKPSEPGYSNAAATLSIIRYDKVVIKKYAEFEYDLEVSMGFTFSD